MSTNIKHIEQTEIMPGFKGQFIHSKSFTIAFWEIEKGSKLPKHSHIHEQTTLVTEGKLELTIDGNTQLFESGCIAIIPPNVEHSGKALTNCKVTDTFYPVREDYT